MNLFFFIKKDEQNFKQHFYLSWQPIRYLFVVNMYTKWLCKFFTYILLKSFKKTYLYLIIIKFYWGRKKKRTLHCQGYKMNYWTQILIICIITSNRDCEETLDFIVVVDLLVCAFDSMCCLPVLMKYNHIPERWSTFAVTWVVHSCLPSSYSISFFLW